jgi:CRP/FNR family cyclic AMP-dependent transcriptional regulator
MSIDANRQYLQSVGIFSGISSDELRDLSARMQSREYPAGAIIVGQEDSGDSLFVLTEGRVKVVLYGDSGREVILSILRAGEIFGEMSLFDNEPRSANVIALEPTRALVLERAAFVRHVSSSPHVALQILAELSRRLRQADRVIGNLALLDVYGRVARVLQDMANKDGVETEDGILIRERPTQQEIASMVGTSRETVSRALNDFSRRGLILMNGKQLLLRHGFQLGEFDTP